MKKTLAFFLLLFSFSSFAFGYSDFCDGYREGYKQGYCYHEGFGCLDPIPPICPVPDIGERSYEDGYNRGFLDGLNDRR